jgi:hypothetical protein
MLHTAITIGAVEIVLPYPTLNPPPCSRALRAPAWILAPPFRMAWKMLSLLVTPIR